MAQGPILIFDKSSLESLNLDEAVLLDNFYLSNITPLFFVECLADLEKEIKSRSTPEQLVGSLALRTPEAQVCANVHHHQILGGELSRHFDLSTVYERPLIAGGKPIQLGDQRGMFYKRSPEVEALERWGHHQFLEVERQFAKNWRQALLRLDHDTLVRTVMDFLGPWRAPRSLSDARQLTDVIVDNIDPARLLMFGMDLLGFADARKWVMDDWVAKRRPALRSYAPYFVHIMSINIFFCLVIPTQLLSNVKESHQIDLAYLYYLPFCSVFTSKDRFHKQVAPLFITQHQTFVEGHELKEDLRKLDAFYSQQPPEVLEKGLFHYALEPPEDTGFLITRLWDKYLPSWRQKDPDRPDLDDPKVQADIMEKLKGFDENAPEAQSHNEDNLDNLDFVTISRHVRATKGKWRIFSKETEEKMRAG